VDPVPLHRAAPRPGGQYLASAEVGTRAHSAADASVDAVLLLGPLPPARARRPPQGPCRARGVGRRNDPRAAISRLLQR
jgi:hypothetical protein